MTEVYRGFSRTYRVVAHHAGENSQETIVELECDDSNVANPRFEMRNAQSADLRVNDIVEIIIRRTA